MGACSIYLVAHSADGSPVAPIKVGISRLPLSRLKQLQTSSAYELKLVEYWECSGGDDDARYFERMFHETQAEHRLHGEWFSIAPDKARGIIEMQIMFSIYRLGELTAAEIAKCHPFGELAREAASE